MMKATDTADKTDYHGYDLVVVVGWNIRSEPQRASDNLLSIGMTHWVVNAERRRGFLCWYSLCDLCGENVIVRAGGRWSEHLCEVRLGSESLMRRNEAERKDGAGLRSAKDRGGSKGALCPLRLKVIVGGWVRVKDRRKRKCNVPGRK